MTHHILDLLRAALVHYGYWAVAAALLLENAGVPVPGETVLLLASFLAYIERNLNLGWILLDRTLWRSTSSGAVRAFSLRSCCCQAGREAFYTLRGSHHFVRAIHLRTADHRRAAGRRPPHAMEKVCDL